MKTIELAKEQASFQLLSDWYDRFAAALKFEVNTKRIETSAGFVDVMVTGPPNDDRFDDQAPLLILHGAMSGAPFALGELCDLPARRRIYAVNIPGQSTRAAQVRLDFRSDEYGRWLSEVMDGLGIGQAIICGVSWGGSVALQLAKVFPDRISGLVLVVPASITSGPALKNIWHVALPILRYKMFPSDKNRDRALKGMLTSGDELWSPYLGDAIRHWNVDFSVPPIIHPQDLKRLAAPVFVIAADQDLSFPGEKLLARSQTLFPNLVGSHLLTNSCHSPSFLPSNRQEFTRIFEGALDLISSETKSTDQTVSENGNTSAMTEVVRRYESNDLNAVMAAWESGSRLAHPFLTREFQNQVRLDIPNLYLPNAETWVLERNGVVVGFVALLGNEIGAIFVKEECHRSGAGRALLDKAIQLKGELEVEVFKANSIGRGFYERTGFLFVSESVHEPTGNTVFRLRRTEENAS